MTRIRVGVIGCGEVTQIIHLPTLAQLADRFEVTALCDVSRTVVDGVADAWGVERRFEDPHALVAQPDVDVVLVANPDPFHAEATLAAIAAGQDVLVEKPMCLGLGECDDIVAAAETAGAIVQVGYMRRHAQALAEAKRALEQLGEIRFARVHDVIGHNHLIIERTSRVIRGDDIPPALHAAASDQRDALIEAAVGPLAPDVRGAYDLLLGLGSHDISAMRELLGLPHGVAYATARHAGTYVSATIDYGSYVCQYETGVDAIPRFDAHIEVYGSERVLRVQYDTPYVRNLPVRLSLLDANGRGGLVERAVHPEWGDPFVAEWLAFADSVTQRTQPGASAADFRHDLELFAAMVELMSADPAEMAVSASGPRELGPADDVT
jgi:predicted dehydrogenase